MAMMTHRPGERGRVRGAALVALVVLAGMAIPGAAAWAQGELFVADLGATAITVYARTAGGDVAPLRTISGAATGLSGPFGLAVDAAHDELLVTDFGTSAVTVYARTATGNAGPIRILRGAATRLILPGLLAVAAPAAPVLVSTGPGAGGGPHVRLFQVDPRTTLAAPLGGGFLAYNPGFTGGVQATPVTVGGSVYLVTGVGSGGGPHVRLFRVTDLASGAVTPLGPGFLAYHASFTGGVRVAATTDANGQLFIVTAAGPSGGPHVKVFQVSNLVTGAVVQVGAGFFAYPPGFTGGVNVGAE
jgi:hypothetical protein